MCKVRKTEVGKVLRQMAAGIVALVLVAGCTKTLDSDFGVSARPDASATPALWTGQSERSTADMNVDRFNGGVEYLGETRVDYIGKLNDDNSYSGSPAETAEIEYIIQAGGAKVEPEARLRVNFENEPLDYFVEQMLGGFLGVNYVSSVPLEGTVSFRTEEPIAKSQVLAVVRSIIARHNYVIKMIGGVLHISTPAQINSMEANIENGEQGEFVSRTIPLASQIDPSFAETLRAVLPAGVSVAVNPAGNSLIVRARKDDFADIEQLIGSFATGTAPDNFFAIIYLRQSSPESVATKMAGMFGGQGTAGGLLPDSIIPLEDKQALLVSATSKTAIENVRKLANQLDFGLEDEIMLRMIPLRHVSATELAAQMTEVFAGTGKKVNNEAETEKTAPETDEGFDEAFAKREQGEISVEGTGDFSIVANERSNVLLVKSTYQSFKRIREAVELLDTPASQVVIEATIIEVKITDQLKLGVQWFLSGTGFTVRGSESTSTADAGAQGFAATIEQLMGGVTVNAVIDALDDVTEVNVISSPYLTVLNHKTARLVVGDQIPFSTKSQSSTDDGNVTVTQEIEVMDTGVILEVKPVIRANNSVELNILQEISSADLVSGEVNLTPTVTTREISSDILVNSGHTVLLGGLVQNRKSNMSGGVPKARKIPLIGKLFEQVDNSDTRTEVIVMITPRVARTGSEIGKITDQMRRHMNLPPLYPQEILPARP